MFDLLEQLCNLPGVSGNEDAVRAFVRAYAKPFAAEMREDSIGNLFVKKKGKKEREDTLMVCAHMDEVGMIIKGITEDGYLKFATVGGVDRRILLGKRVCVGKKGITGVIGSRAVHLIGAKEREAVPKTDELYIDIGVKKRLQAERYVSLGDVAWFEPNFRKFGDGLICSKAIDDRVGCAVMLKLLSEEIEYDTWFVFTVQEEVGLRGATTAAYTVDPDRALILEGTTAADLPSANGARRVCEVNRGVVIGLMDGATIYDPKLFATLRTLAEGNGIPWQTKEMVAGGTDAGAVQRSRVGVRCANLAAPVRYLHGPASVTSVSAIEAMLTLARMYVNLEGESA
ncbi:MAG: M42 family metallopeptidase [Oscillospiraceae bacterium]|nr:M42 family metallopeptidase [Oscillospiraceae bacterium]